MQRSLSLFSHDELVALYELMSRPGPPLPRPDGTITGAGAKAERARGLDAALRAVLARNPAVKGP